MVRVEKVLRKCWGSFGVLRKKPISHNLKLSDNIGQNWKKFSEVQSFSVLAKYLIKLYYALVGQLLSVSLSEV